MQKRVNASRGRVGATANRASPLNRGEITRSNADTHGSLSCRHGKPSQAFRSLFLQETIRRGVLAPSFVVSYSHGDRDIDRTIEVIDEALAVCGRARSPTVRSAIWWSALAPVFDRR